MFVTNNRPRVLEQFGMDYETLHAKFPRLVYGQVTGYGPDSESRDTAAYDIGAFWSQAGVAASLTAPGGSDPAAARRHGRPHDGAGPARARSARRSSTARRTGEGQRVSVPLVRVGVYMIGWDVMLSMRIGIPVRDRTTAARRQPDHQLVPRRATGSGSGFCCCRPTATGRTSAGRSSGTTSRATLASQTSRCGGRTARRWSSALDGVFATKPLADWAEIFRREQRLVRACEHGARGSPTIPWCRAGRVRRRAGAGRSDRDGRLASRLLGDEVGAAPIQPELGQHTEEVLLELGYDWDQIIPMKERGVIP